VKGSAIPKNAKDAAQSRLEELVFCDCENSVCCTIERWKVCKHRIQRDAEEVKGATVERG
jgi:hypothetical protein